jgi:hypothetical protein
MSTAKILRCPGCKEYISSEARSCRFCSRPLDAETVRRAVEEQAEENRAYRRKHYLKHIPAGLVVCAIGIVITIGMYTTEGSDAAFGHRVIVRAFIVGGALDFIYGLWGWIGELRSKD